MCSKAEMDMPDMRPDQKAKLFFEGINDMIHLFSGCEKKNQFFAAVTKTEKMAIVN